MAIHDMLLPNDSVEQPSYLLSLLQPGYCIPIVIIAIMVTMCSFMASYIWFCFQDIDDYRYFDPKMLRPPDDNSSLRSRSPFDEVITVSPLLYASCYNFVLTYRRATHACFH